MMNMTMSRALGLGVVLLVAAQPAEARPFRLNQVPNAPSSQPDSCNWCHTNGGGTPRNPFGLDVEATLDAGNVDWEAIFELDSDNDGFTNGQELGDPDGTWRTGRPKPETPFYSPANADSLPECGNGALDAVNDEDCDGADFGDESCESRGFSSGNLSCTGDCRIDDSACVADLPDAGMPDVFESPDTVDLPDAGTGLPDAATGQPDASGSAPSSGDDGGCRCLRPTHGSVAAPLLLFGLVGLGRRRRARRARARS